MAKVESKKVLDVDDEGKCVNSMQIVPLEVPLEVLAPCSQPPQQHYHGHAVFASTKRGVLGVGSWVSKEGTTNILGVREKGVEGWGRGERGEEEPAGLGWKMQRRERSKPGNLKERSLAVTAEQKREARVWRK